RYVVSVQESANGKGYRGTGAPPKESEVRDAVSKVSGVRRVIELPTDERAHAYHLTSDDDADLRPDLFRLIADKGWVLLELHRDTQTLEDVFRDLTVGEAKRNRKIKGAKYEEPEEEEEDEDLDDEEEDDEDEGDSDEEDSE
ncbi:MAG: ATP-binding cassette domain-containing protein, partial [Polyangiaceae bacterium]